MIQTLPKTVTFEEFIEWYPNNAVRYELHNGVIIEMAPPSGDHEKVVGFLGVARVPRVEATDASAALATSGASPVRVSSNWRDDYHLKFADYEQMGIPEFWIVDYAALGGKRFIGDPKQPTFSVCQLVEDEYQVTKFTGNNLILSSTFPQLNLTAQEVFDAAL